MNRLYFKIIIEEIEKAFINSNGSREKQLGLVYLINELIQNQSADVVELFKPLFENVAAKAAETRDSDLIYRVKRTLGVLVERKYFDQIYACKVLNIIETRASTGAGAETEACDQLIALTKKLNTILQNEKQKDGSATKEEKAFMLEEEQNTRENIVNFFANQASRQYERINEIKKITKQTKEDEKKQSLKEQFSDDSSDSYSDSFMK